MTHKIKNYDAFKKSELYFDLEFLSNNNNYDNYYILNVDSLLMEGHKNYTTVTATS